MPTHFLDGLAAVALALDCLPLAARRRWPVVCLAAVSLGFAVGRLRAYHLLAGAALLIALLGAGSLLARHRRVTVSHHVTAMVEADRCPTAAPECLDQTPATVGDTGRRAIAGRGQLRRHRPARHHVPAGDDPSCSLPRHADRAVRCRLYRE